MAIREFLRGAGGPIVEFLIYVDVGVDWTLKPVGFKTKEAGADAKTICDDICKEMNLYSSVNQFAAWREVTSRAVAVKTYNAMDGFYISKREKVNGFDCIDPTTLDMNSIEQVMADRTGTENYIQNPPSNQPLKNVNWDTVDLEQDRVIYRVRNPLTNHATHGISIFQPAYTDLVTANRFPRYRMKIARKYSSVLRHITIDDGALAESPQGLNILMNNETADDYLDRTIEMVEEQERRGTNLYTWKFIESNNETYGGKEPDLPGVESQTMKSIGYKVGVPIQLTMFPENMNRASMDTLSDLFVARRERGPRKQVYEPIIREVCDDILRSEGFTEGHMEINWNPFMSKDKDAITQRVVAAVGAGLEGFVEGRRELDLPDKIEMTEEEKEIRGLYQALFKQQGGPGSAQSPEQYIGKPGQTIPSKQQTLNMTEVALNPILIHGNHIRPLYLEETE
jgi:hypothetical protein